MSSLTIKVQVGDVITAKEFAFGRWNSDRSVISVDGETREAPVTSNISEEARLKAAARTGKIPPKTKTEDFGAYDESRGKAEFVVEEAKLAGGSRAPSDYHPYPDDWFVTARRLKPNGAYDPEGEVITFYQTGDAWRDGVIKNVYRVGEMKRIFV